MTKEDAQIVVQKARENYPGQKPRIISDNGPQFISADFKSFLGICEMTHVTTAPDYPQSNGKLERYHRSLKSEAIRPNCLLDSEDAIDIITRYIANYNHVRLHSAIGYVPPAARLSGEDKVLQSHRREKLRQAARRRKAPPCSCKQRESAPNPPFLF